MSYIAFVIAKDGTRLMPCLNPKKVRKLLKEGRAVIAGYKPFTIQLTYESGKEKQPVEMSIDAGDRHVGNSIKSEKHEFIHEQRDLLKDGKQKHDDQRRLRRTRRNRKRYRKPRFDNRRIPEGWLAPSIRNKKNIHVMLYDTYRKVIPITDVFIETGSFDTNALHLQEQGLPAPEETDYQHGPRFGYDNLREAVFYRDHHTCQICGSTIGQIKKKDGSFKPGEVILRMHHIGYRTGDRTDRMSNLLTVCTRCHTPNNHKPGGKLYDLEPVTRTISGAAFMNTVRWYVFNEIKAIDSAVHVHMTYGSVTKRERLSRRIRKTHANDAYCIGYFRPKHKASEEIFQKIRRNNRCLEKFYDAVYIDSRTGERASGGSLSCGRTNRSESRNSDTNKRIYHGRKRTKGYRNIRRKRHPLQAGDKVIFQGKKYTVKASRTRYTKTHGFHETVELKEIPKEHLLEEIKLVSHISGWKKVQPAS